jgi:hypothetical protein
MDRASRTLGSSALMIGASLLALAACSFGGKDAQQAASATASADLPSANPENNVYFGVVHVHTAWSFDALINGTRATPMDAYAWAQGKPIDAAYRNAGRPGAPGMSRRPACRATTRALVAKKGRQA